MPGSFWDDIEDAPPPPPPLTETNYYVFYPSKGDNSAKISRGPKLPPTHDTWNTGRRVDYPLATPLVYEIVPDDEGELRPYHREPGAPLMSKELLAVLRSAGVDNIDSYPAVVRELRTGREHHDHEAVNILGLVAGADLSRSQYNPSALDGEAKVNTWFDKLVLDEKKIAGQLLFRLAENVGIVLVHKTIRDAIQKSRIKGVDLLRFVHPAEWSG